MIRLQPSKELLFGKLKQGGEVKANPANDKGLVLDINSLTNF